MTSFKFKFPTLYAQSCSPNTVSSTAKAISSTTTTGRLSTLNSTTFELSSGSGLSVDEAFPHGRILEVPNLRIYTLAELKSATKNFNAGTVLGYGGFGKVFKGWVDEKTLTPAKSGFGMVVAVKKLPNFESMQDLEEWQSEVNFLGRLSHPNIVKLLGYCREDRRKLLLVYEFMPIGSLDNHLFRGGSAFEPLSWIIRLKIAIGAARGLAFLHSLEKEIIDNDFTTSNILLDSNFNAKLSHFGLARNVHLNVTTKALEGTFFLKMASIDIGDVYVKSDVYRFGVVLLEMLSGQRAHDPLRPSGQFNLVDWAKSFLADGKQLARLMDPRLEGQYSSKGAAQAAQLTLECLAKVPRRRPSMKEVVEILEEIEAMECRSSEAKDAFSHHKARGHNKAPWSPLNARHE